MAVAVTPANVRDLIDVSLTSEQLSDATINRSAYAGRAVLEVKERDPDWNTRTGGDETRLNVAADNLCAAYLVRKMPWLTGESASGQSSYSRQQTDVSELISELLATAAEQIEKVTGDESGSMPTMFTVASGGRGL